MSALVKNVFLNFRGYRSCFSKSFISELRLTSSAKSSAGDSLLITSESNPHQFQRCLSSLSPPNNERASFQPRFDEGGRFDRQSQDRRPNNNFRRQNDSENESFEEDVEALGDLNKRHRQGATSEYVTSSSKSFSEFPLHPTLISSLDNLGYTSPFDIQIKTLEHTLEGRDVIGQAVTGSGKTLAFAIPIVHKIRKSRIDAGERVTSSPRAIVVAPTRELCNQIYRSIQELDPLVRCVALYGGDPYARQEREIFRGIDVICATPGRLNDHLQRKNIKLDKLEFLCLDEADELLNPNFREQIEDLFKDSPSSKQVMMFSATMPPEIKDIASRFLNNPVHVLVSNKDQSQAPQNIEHQCVCAPSHTFINVVAKMINDLSAERCIVFLKTKAFCGIFANNLRRYGLACDALHSDLSQSSRERILSSFRMGNIKVLCATDVAARGLDIPEVDVVFQVEPPANGLEFYIHRAGRTGRGGRKGLAVLLHSGSAEELRSIRTIGQMVKLNHIKTQDDVVDNFRERNLNAALQLLKTLELTSKEKDAVQPIAEKLLSTEDNVTLLTKVLSMLSKNNVANSYRNPSTSFINSEVDQYASNHSAPNRYATNRYATNRYASNQYAPRTSQRNNYRDSRSLWNDDE